MSHGPIGGKGRGKGFGGKGFSGKGFGGYASAPGTRVYVGNLSWDTSWQGGCAGRTRARVRLNLRAAPLAQLTRAQSLVLTGSHIDGTQI